MSLTKKDRKTRYPYGNEFPVTDHVARVGAGGFASAIATALHQDFGETRGAIKTIVSLTDANERAVKNWFEGRNAPSGEFLIALCRHSDRVLETVLMLAGRTELVTAKKLVDAKAKLREMLAMIDEIEQQPPEEGR
jgi:hypothetical protein